MYPLGFATGQECARLLVELARDGQLPVEPPVIAIVIDHDGQRYVDYQEVGADGDSVRIASDLEDALLEDEAVSEAVVVDTDLASRIVMMTFCRRGHDPQRVHYHLRYERLGGRIKTSAIPVDGFEDGIAASEPAIPIEVGVLDEPRIGLTAVCVVVQGGPECEH